MTALADRLRDHLGTPAPKGPAPDREAKLAITRARIGLLSETPFFGALALRLSPVEDRGLKSAMSTDGTVLRYNPEQINEARFDDVKSLIALHVMRCAALHPFRRGSRDAEQWNKAGEYAVTPILKDAGFEPPPGALYNERFRDHSAEQVFSIIEAERQEQERSGGQPGQSGAGAQGDQNRPGVSQVDDAPPGDASGSGGDQEAGAQGQQEAPTPSQGEQDWKVAALQADMASKRRGELPGGAQRILNEIKSPTQDWRMILRQFVMATAKSDYRWTPPNKRYLSMGLCLPTLRNEQLGEIAVIIDTSGSINQAMLDRFGAELAGIIEDAQPERTRVIYCDAAVQKVAVFELGEPLELEKVGAGIGGGGTDFRPPFAYLEAEDINPACVVYLTDMEGTFPDEEPPMPVLWGSTSHILTAPFGEVIEVPSWE